MTLTQRILGSRTLAALTSPHGVDRYLELVNPMWAATEVRARVVSVVRETHGPASETAPVATSPCSPPPPGAGTAPDSTSRSASRSPGHGARRAASRSPRPSPAPVSRSRITVRAHEEGLVSKYLVREAQPGLVVHLSQAEGEFTLTESPATPTNNHLLMISGGSGITPVMSQLRTLLRDGYDGKAGRKVTFLHYARSREDQIFAEELQRIAWADNGVGRCTCATATTSSPRRLCDAWSPAYRDTDTWACGPAGLMELGAGGLRRVAAPAHGVLQALHPPRRRHGLARGRPVLHADRDVGRQHRRLDARAGRGRRAQAPSSAVAWASASPARRTRARAPSATS